MKKIFIIWLLTSSIIFAQSNTESKILAQNANYQYTQAHFNKSLRFVEFLIGTTLQESDKQQMLQETIQNFNQNAIAVINEVNNIDTQMQQLYQLTDVSQIARIRSALIAQIYINAQQNQQAQQSFIVRMLNKYVPLLAIDTQNLWAFTYKDFEGFVKLMQFNYQLAGQQVQFSQQDLLQLKNLLTQQFYSMTLAQKQYLCSMQTLSDYMINVYAQMTPQQKQQWAAQMQNNQSYTYNQTNNYQNTGKRGSGSNAAAMKIYYDSMMSNHATMMNVFENYDSNRYWEYKY